MDLFVCDAVEFRHFCYYNLMNVDLTERETDRQMLLAGR